MQAFCETCPIKKYRAPNGKGCLIDIDRIERNIFAPTIRLLEAEIADAKRKSKKAVK